MSDPADTMAKTPDAGTEDMMEKKGCGYWTLTVVAGVTALSVLVYMFGFVLALVAGFGSWFVMRHAWHALAARRPQSLVVDLWINRPPLARRAAACVVSIALAILVFGSYYASLATQSSEVPGVPNTSYTTEQPRASDSAGS